MKKVNKSKTVAATVKPQVKTQQETMTLVLDAKDLTPAKEEVVEAPKVVEAKTEEKAVVKEAPKTEAKPVEKATVKKETVKKEAAKKEEVKVSTVLQLPNDSYTEEDLVKIATDVWVYDLKQKAEDLKEVKLYVKPQEHKVYYVINENVTGNFNI